MAEPLTPQQSRALALLREGRSTAEVAKLVGQPRPTVWRWQQTLPQFAGTLEADPGSAGASASLTRPEKLRVGVTLLLVVLAALFTYLGYGR